MNNRCIYLKTANQLNEDEKKRISKEYDNICSLLINIFKDEYNQLLDGEFENIIKAIDANLDEIAKTEDGNYAKYIHIENDYIAIKTRGEIIVKGYYKDRK